MLPVAVARSSSEDNAICHVLPILWMTSRFHITKTTLFRRVSQVAAPGAKLLPTIAGLLMHKFE